MKSTRPNLIRSAVLSDCTAYRYEAWRSWASAGSSAPYAMFIGLNPSDADHEVDDRTINRCMSFAETWGYSRLCMMNLFAFRTPYPKVMKKAADPVGPETDAHLQSVGKKAGIVVAAWGNDGAFKARDKAVLAMFPALHALRMTGKGHPEHPLYMPGATKPFLIERESRG